MTSPYIYILPLLLQQMWGISAFNNSSTSQLTNPSGIAKSPNNITKRIQLGKLVYDIKRYPFMASVQNVLNLTFVDCGAIIIHPTWALTTAQCLYVGDRPKATYEAVVITGITNMKEINDYNINYPAKLFPHESYTRDEVTDDIGLILLDTPVRNISSFGLARLPNNVINPWEEPSEIFRTCHTLGWISKHSDLLKVLDLPIVNNNACYSILQNSKHYLEPYTQVPNLNTHVICAQNTRSIEDGCPGKEGGPLMCDNYLVGVYTWGTLFCEDVQYPKLFLRVDLYLDWIYKKIPKSQLQSFGNILRKLSIVFTFIEIWTVI